MNMIIPSNEAVPAKLYRNELTQRLKLQAENARLKDTIYMIAYLPFGPADATCAQVLNDITELARETLKAVQS